MALSGRYPIPHPPGERSGYGLDLAGILPMGAEVTLAEVNINLNLNPQEDQYDLNPIGEIQVIGRRLWVILSGGVSGEDYQVVWDVTDEQGNTWEATVNLLCAPVN
jgi:hypothetical protein